VPPPGLSRSLIKEFTLLAHDLGGLSGLAAVVTVAERARGIVAMNTFGWKPSGSALRPILATMGSGIIREIDAVTNFIPRISSTSCFVGRHLDSASRSAFRAGTASESRRAFHNYMRDACRCDVSYERIGTALAAPFTELPMFTIFGERNGPFHFQRRWKALFPDAAQMAVSKGNHFPMCDAPELVAKAIRAWHANKVNT
jgi:pimeloyl-ACP methyl ester carboxylesterase